MRKVYVCNVASPEVEPLLMPVINFGEDNKENKSTKTEINNDNEPLLMPVINFEKE